MRGGSALFIAGWLELIGSGSQRPRAQATPEILARHREEVIPHSGFFAVHDWHALEEGQQRWTQAMAWAIFRNPQKPVALEIEGVNYHRPDRIAPANVMVQLNGHALGELNTPGAFRQRYLVSPEILGSALWGDLAIAVSRTFNPKQGGFSADPRDLGILLTRVELADLELAADGLIDFGTAAAGRHLGPGWSSDEQVEGFTLVWANAQESELWVAMPQPVPVTMELRVFPFPHPSSAAQALHVSADGKPVGELVLRERQWQIFSLTLPPSFLSPGLNMFRMVYAYAVSPADVHPGDRDRRTLAVAFDFIRFRPE